MNFNDVMSSSCNLFSEGKFTDCCELLQRIVDDNHLKESTIQNEVEFIVLRNNLIVCNCLRILPTMSIEYAGKMTELLNISLLYLYEKHIPLELRMNFVYNTLYWYWLKPDDVPDFCYNKVITLVNECLLEVLRENEMSIVNSSSHIGKEQSLLNCLESLSNEFLRLEPILVVQCLEMSQILLLVFLSRQCFTSLLLHFTVQLIDQIKTITSAFKQKQPKHIFKCYKLGISKINDFLDTENNVKSVIVCSHVSLCVKYILDNQYDQALCALSTIDQYLDPNDELFCLVCYLKAMINFNLKEFEVTLYYLSQMARCLMEPFTKSRCYLLLGRTHSKMGNGDLAIITFEKLKEFKFNKIMAYYMSQHYEENNMHFTQMMVLEQVIKEHYNEKNNVHFAISFSSKVLVILHPQPDLTRKQLLYMAAIKKYENSNYKLAAAAYSSLLKLNTFEEYVSNLVTIPSDFMLKHEAAVALLKAHEMEKAFRMCQSLIEEFEPGCNMWKSDSFWADELNNYNFNVVGAMLLTESSMNQNVDIILEALNKSYNCLYANISSDYQTETNSYDENIKTLQRILIGKILLLKATVLSRLDNEEDCDLVFKKALTYNAGDEDIVYSYSKWLEHKGKITQSMNVRNQFDPKKINTIKCDNFVITYVLENKHGIEDAIVSDNVIDDLFVSPTENDKEVHNEEMDPADDDIFNDLFLD